MEPQFVLNIGGLDKLGFSESEFLELLEIDLTKAVPGGILSCPKCKRSCEDVNFVFHRYDKFDLANTSKEYAKYSFERTDFNSCICGCLYTLRTKGECGLGFEPKRNQKG